MASLEDITGNSEDAGMKEFPAFGMLMLIAASEEGRDEDQSGTLGVERGNEKPRPCT